MTSWFEINQAIKFMEDADQRLTDMQREREDERKGRLKAEARVAELEDALGLSQEETACQEIGAIALRERVAELEAELTAERAVFDDAAHARYAPLIARVAELEAWAKEVLDHTRADAFPNYIDLTILCREAT